MRSPPRRVRHVVAPSVALRAGCRPAHPVGVARRASRWVLRATPPLGLTAAMRTRDTRITGSTGSMVPVSSHAHIHSACSCIDSSKHFVDLIQTSSGPSRHVPGSSGVAGVAPRRLRGVRRDVAVANSPDGCRRQGGFMQTGRGTHRRCASVHRASTHRAERNASNAAVGIQDQRGHTRCLCGDVEVGRRRDEAHRLSSRNRSGAAMPSPCARWS